MEKPIQSSSNNSLRPIFLIASYISWVAVAVNNWISLHWFYSKKYRTVWNIYIYLDIESFEYAPFQMHYIMNYIVFNFVFAVITIGCIVFFVKTLIQKDPQVIEGMMGNFSQFHFFPLLCAFIMSILGELGAHADKPEEFFKGDKAGLAISLVGLISMIFIYIMTDLNTNDWWVLLLLKKGAFSCLIILMWYSFCYDIFYVHFYDKKGENENDPFEGYFSEKMWDWKKGCGLAFSIILGVGSLAFSFVFKDLAACVMNLLIYIGLTVAYFRLPSEARKLKEFNKNGDGIVDIIMLVLSVAVIVLLLIKYRENCMKS